MNDIDINAIERDNFQRKVITLFIVCIVSFEPNELYLDTIVGSWREKCKSVQK